jgi:hypothetical protein
MSKLKMWGIFALGLALGVIITVVLVLQGPIRATQQVWATMISEHALHARMLHDGKANEVKKQLEDTFLPSAYGMEAMRFPQNLRERTLWTIRKYYESTGQTPSTELSTILAKLPPKEGPQATPGLSSTLTNKYPPPSQP